MKRRSRTGVWLERTIALAGCALVVAILSILGYDAFFGTTGPPDIRVRVIGVTSLPESYLVRFEITNHGRLSAADVVVVGRLVVDSTVEERRVRIDYVPRGSSSTGGMLFAADPVTGRLSLMAEGFQEP